MIKMGPRQLILKYNPINVYRIWTERKRLKRNVTILASNCIGGILYHDLGQRFLSPTVNTRFDSPDFVKFVCNIHHYLQVELVFIESSESFPVAMLDDIRVYFVHYKSPEEAERKWRERIGRIDWNHVYVLLNDNDGMKEEDYECLDRCPFENILILSAQAREHHRGCFQLKQFADLKEVGNTMKKSIFTGKMEAQKCFDFVGWFNGEKGNNIENYRIK